MSGECEFCGKHTLDCKCKIYPVTLRLPANGQKCLCYGYKTVCCKEDMEDEPGWHEVIFEFIISSYRVKKRLPDDIEESMLDSYTVIELWNAETDYCEAHVIGVTQWMNLPKSNNCNH